MNKLIMTLLLVLSAFSLFAQEVQLQFTTINGYGNNLYIDNVNVGNQKNLDVGVLSINNILPDTSYLLGSSSVFIAPIVGVINVGKNNVTSPFNVTMTITPGTYSSTKSIASLNSGQSQNLTFDNVTINPAQPLNITVTTNLTGDENPANNTLNQFSIYFTGVQRKVLLEEWTSSTCGPCAANNPTVDAFISARFDSLVPIKYHMNWPAPGNDPMYAYNPTQANDRRFYYGVNGVPHVIMDGVVIPTYPYSNAPSLPDAFYPRKNVGTPISMTVTDTRLPGDTIKTDITVQVIAPLKAGQYYLRVHAIERKITYATPPGSNGESIFYDVFRKAYPTSLGTVVPTAVGNYNFTFKYKLDLPTWVDSMIYTAAFIQNDATKEVLNSGKARNYTLENILTSNFNGMPVEKPVIDFGFSDEENYSGAIIANESMSNTFAYEFFESSFPAPGWKIVNPDAGITFAQFTGANGPSFGGNKSVKLDFYSYSSTGRADTLYSKIFTGLNAADTLKFDWAYAEYSSQYTDRMIVKLSQDGGLTFPYTLFDKSGSALATAPSTTNSFTPTAGQWKTFSYGLSMLIPVELTAFTASAIGSSVELRWQTATEKNNLGFEVQRKLGNEFVTIGHVRGNGTTTHSQLYSYKDKDLAAGNYMYRLKQVDYNGAFEYSKIVEIEIATPKTFSLEQNYPNPFNPTTKINFNLAVDSKVMLKVFNLLGEEVRTLIYGNLSAGSHKIDFNAANLNNGIYIYKLEAVGIDGSTFTDVKKMTLIK